MSDKSIIFGEIGRNAKLVPTNRTRIGDVILLSDQTDKLGLPQFSRGPQRIATLLRNLRNVVSLAAE